jgi:hypothetical protein
MKAKAFALCLDNKDCEASLELLKLYPLAPAERNDPTGYIRIIDESGEDYLYPAAAFDIMILPARIKRRIAEVP